MIKQLIKLILLILGGESQYRYEEKKRMRRKSIDNMDISDLEKVKKHRELDKIEEGER